MPDRGGGVGDEAGEGLRTPHPHARRICIVSEECAGLNRSGGIGACTRGLALHLVQLGYAVDLLLTDLSSASLPADATDGRLGRLLRLADIAEADVEIERPVGQRSKAYAIYRHLRREAYDVVHFHDYLGLGYFAATARRQGLLNSRIVTHAHGTTQWVRRHNLNRPSQEDLEVEAIECRQLEFSDLVVAPSAYLLDWFHAQGLQLPEAIRQDWILPQWVEGATPGGPLETRALAAGTVDELIFFGRHERRKGFDLFIEAARLLPRDRAPNLTFLGRFDRLHGEFTGTHALRRLANYPGAIRFLHDFDQAAAMAYIGGRANALCVMPSRIENSPCTVGECFTLGIPFLATDVGGTPELTAPEHRRDPPLDATARSLAAHIENALSVGLPAIRASLDPPVILRAWEALHARLAAQAARPEPKPATKKTPLVSVCLVHHERPALLARALSALDAQTYGAFEVILVDDGSRSDETRAALDALDRDRARFHFPLTIIRGENRYLGAARNAAARTARGDYLLFHDDDNIAEPHEIETFVASALATGADVLTCQSYIFEGEPGEQKILFFPIGIGGPFSFFQNSFGDANALWRREAFERLGGFSELHGLGWEDWELFLKAYIRGLTTAVVPEPLFWYRASQGGMLGAGNPVLNRERLYALVAAEKPTLGEDLLRLAQGPLVSREERERTRHALGLLPFAHLHVRAMRLDPNGAEAARVLVDLAAALGRHDDAATHAARDPSTAATWRDLVGDGGAPGEVVFEYSEPPQRAVILNGWWTGETLPEFIEIGDRHFRIRAMRRSPRSDVSAALRRESQAGFGFEVVAEPTQSGAGTLSRWLKKRVRLGLDRTIDRGNEVRFVVPHGGDERGHIDRLSFARLANRLAFERETLVELVSETALDASIILGDKLAAPTAVTRGRLRFRLPPGVAVIVAASEAPPSLTVY